MFVALKPQKNVLYRKQQSVFTDLYRLYKHCYGKMKMETESLNKLIETLNTTGLEMVKHNLQGFKYQNNELPHVREWINKKEQELKNIELQNIRKNASQNKIYKKFKHVYFNIKQTIINNLPYIIKGVIVGILIIFVVWCINYFFHINLKP